MALAGSPLERLVHPELHELLEKFYPTSVTIQTAIETQKANGEVVRTWVDWLINLTGNFAMTRGSEVRGTTMTTVLKGRALNLAGYYPEILVTHRAVVQGVPYNILSVTHDSLSESTRLDLEEVSF